MTYQQEQHEMRESQRRHIASQLLKPNSVAVKQCGAFNGLAACDLSERRPVYVTLSRTDTLDLFDDLLQCLELADLQHVMARAIERRTVLIRGNVDAFTDEEPPTKREGSGSSWPAPARGADDVLRGAT
jgi:hypothetical protein